MISSRNRMAHVASVTITILVLLFQFLAQPSQAEAPPTSDFFGGFLGRFLNCDHDPFWQNFRTRLKASPAGILDPEVLGATYHVWKRWNGWIDLLEVKGHFQNSNLRLFYTVEDLAMKSVSNYQELIDTVTYAHHQALFQHRYTDFSEQNIRVYNPEVFANHRENSRLAGDGDSNSNSSEPSRSLLHTYSMGLTLSEAGADYTAKSAKIRELAAQAFQARGASDPEELEDTISAYTEEETNKVSIFGDPSSFQLFLKCPIGYMVMHFIVMTVQRIRSHPSWEEMDLFWRNHMRIMNSLMGWPAFSLDFLDASDWGLSAFDMLVNVKRIGWKGGVGEGEEGEEEKAEAVADEQREHFRDYEDFFRQKPLSFDVTEGNKLLELAAANGDGDEADSTTDLASIIPTARARIESPSLGHLQAAVAAWREKHGIAKRASAAMERPVTGAGERKPSAEDPASPAPKEPPYKPSWLEVLSKQLFVRIMLLELARSMRENDDHDEQQPATVSQSVATDIRAISPYASEVLGFFECWTTGMTTAVSTSRNQANDRVLLALFQTVAKRVGVPSTRMKHRIFEVYHRHAWVSWSSSSSQHHRGLAAPASVVADRHRLLVQLVSPPAGLPVPFHPGQSGRLLSLSSADANSAFLRTPSSPAPVKICAFGEHGPTNMDYLSSLTAALNLNPPGPDDEHGAHDHNLRPKNAPEIQHFFSHKWNLDKTSQGEQMQTRVSWLEFWGMPLTKSQGNTHSEDVTPKLEKFFGSEKNTDFGRRDVRYERKEQWTLSEAVSELQQFLREDEFFRSADLMLGCEPFWLCPVLHAVRKLLRAEMKMLATSDHHSEGRARDLPLFLPRLNMCPMFLYNGHVRDDEHLSIFGLLRDMLLESTAAPLAAACRISAEMFAFQFRKEIPYVPFLGLHTSPAKWFPVKGEEILVFRTFLPMVHTFLRVLQMFQGHFAPTTEGAEDEDAQKLQDDEQLPRSEETYAQVVRRELDGDEQEEAATAGPKKNLNNLRRATPRRFVTMDPGKNYDYQEIGSYAAVVLLPHVPNALRLSDMQAIGVPVFVPAEPYIHKIVWPFAGPYCGRTSPEEIVRKPAAGRELFQWASWVADGVGDENGRGGSEEDYTTRSGGNHHLQDHEFLNTIFDSSNFVPRHKYSPFDFQSTQELLFERFHHDRRYWLQYTEWAERGDVLFKFSSVRHLFFLGSSISEQELKEMSGRMGLDQERRKAMALGWWRYAVGLVVVNAEQE